MRRSWIAVLLLLPVLTPAAGATDCRPSAEHFPPGPPTPPGTNCRLIQPGMAIYVGSNSDEYPFTMSVLLRGSDGRLYFVLTGTSVRVGEDPPFHVAFERRYAPGTEPPVRSEWGQVIGRVLYARTDRFPQYGYPKVDFALVRVERGVAVSRNIRGIGAPGPLDTRLTNASQDLVMYGQGTNFGEDYHRTATAPYGLDDDRVVYTTFRSNGYNVGAPVLGPDRRVIGYHNGAWTWRPYQSGDIVETRFGVPVYRLAPVLARAPKAIGVRLTLA